MQTSEIYIDSDSKVHVASIDDPLVHLLCLRVNRVTVEVVGDEAALGLLETSLLAWASDFAADLLPGNNVTADAPETT